MWQMITGAVGFSVFAIPCFEGVLNLGNLTGMGIFGVMFLWGLLRKKIKPKLAELRKKKPLKILTNTFCILFCVFLVYCTVAGGFIIKGMVNTPPDDTTTVIVLGCRVYSYGPSSTLRERLNKAANYLETHPDAVCIVTGGQGWDEPSPEAEVMAEYLKVLGIESKRIYKETTSTSTKENLVNALEIIKENNLSTKVAIATSEYHELRASIAAKKIGLTAYSLPADSPKEMFATYFLREILALPAELFLR